MLPELSATSGVRLGVLPPGGLSLTVKFQIESGMSNQGHGVQRQLGEAYSLAKLALIPENSLTAFYMQQTG